MDQAWFPAITTTSLLAAVLWLSRQLIAARLSKSVQFKFDKKIEAIRHEIRAKEEGFKAELREKESEIVALRDGALTALSNRQLAFYNRRLEAVDQLWASFNALNSARFVAEFMLDPTLARLTPERVKKETKFRDLLQILEDSFDIKLLGQDGADRARPFLDPMVWAIYSAYRAVILAGALRASALKSGKGILFDSEVMQAMLLSALPSHEEEIKNMNPLLYATLLGALEDRLLEEIRRMLRGIESDRATLEQAEAIIRNAKSIESERYKAHLTGGSLDGGTNRVDGGMT